MDRFQSMEIGYEAYGATIENVTFEDTVYNYHKADEYS